MLAKVVKVVWGTFCGCFCPTLPFISSFCAINVNVAVFLLWPADWNQLIVVRVLELTSGIDRQTNKSKELDYWELVFSIPIPVHYSCSRLNIFLPCLCGDFPKVCGGHHYWQCGGISSFVRNCAGLVCVTVSRGCNSHIGQQVSLEMGFRLFWNLRTRLALPITSTWSLFKLRWRPSSNFFSAAPQQISASVSPRPKHPLVTAALYTSSLTGGHVNLFCGSSFPVACMSV